MVIERLKFYADTPEVKNKYFCYKITSILSLKEALFRFYDKGWYIRSAWYEKIDQDSGEILENTKIELAPIIEERIQKVIDDSKRHKNKKI